MIESGEPLYSVDIYCENKKKFNSDFLQFQFGYFSRIIQTRC